MAGGDSSRFEAAIVPVSERRFYGSYERVDGQMRVNTGFGHYSFADSVHRWYVKDWKGSVRHTAYQNKATGKMSFGQHTFVYPSGLPVITGNPGNIDRFHQDKRWIDAEGLDMYDNQARMYDPVYVRFTTPDELAEEFRGHSPWAYCLGNPVMRIDTDGRRARNPERAAANPGYQTSANPQDDDPPLLVNEGETQEAESNKTPKISTFIAIVTTPFGIINSRIDSAIKASEMGKDIRCLSNTLKFFGYVGLSYNVGSNVYTMATYHEAGGTNPIVYTKCFLDIGLNAAGNFGGDYAPYFIGASVVFTLIDVKTDGFGTNKIVNQQLKNKDERDETVR
ncbi:MAG: hypothetical protein K2L16_07395 [Muribaculaceae bacterium]|nr:hypothetical protein [Muribaculaceae bacterium]